MRSFSDIRIKWKLILLVLIACTISIGSAGLALFTFQSYVLRSALQRDMVSTAAVVASQCAAAVLFEDQPGARKVLESLRAKPEIVAASIRKLEGNELAGTGHAITEDLAAGPAVREARWLTNRSLLARSPVVWQGQVHGSVYLIADYSRTYGELQRLYGSVLLAVLAGALLVGLVASGALQSLVSRPILRLAGTARSIAERQDYTLRVHREANDEVGILTDAFNHMLDRIQADTALREANRVLGDEIHARRRDEAALRERLRLEALNAEMGRALSRKAPMEEILQACCTALVAQLELRRAEVWLKARDAPSDCACRFSSGEGNHAPADAHDTNHGSALVRRALHENRPLFSDAEESIGPRPENSGPASDEALSVAAHPLVVGDESFGVLALFTDRPFSGPVRQTLGAMANALVLGIQRHQAETALQESEQRFRSVFENATIGIYRSTDQGRILLANPSLARMLGYGSSDELIGLELISDGESAREQRRQFLRSIHEAGSRQGVEWCLTRSDGQAVHLCESAKAVQDPRTGETHYEGVVEDITARKLAEANLERLHRELVDASRTAGMAEVATGVLHNVGNVLNSVNVSVNLLQDRVRKSTVSLLPRTVALLTERQSDLGAFLTHDPKGRLIPGFLSTLADQLQAEENALTRELSDLARSVEHIKEIVAMQQSYARLSGVREILPAEQLIEDALRMNDAALERHHIVIARAYQSHPDVDVDRHKALQILINLIRNAKYALSNGNGSAAQRRLTLGLQTLDDRVRFTVQDNGIGIAKENLTQIFSHGFTTKHDGHGFGLHSGALAAREMGGSLAGTSEGPGCGAIFTLDLPLAQRTAPTT